MNSKTYKPIHGGYPTPKMLRGFNNKTYTVKYEDFLRGPFTIFDRLRHEHQRGRNAGLGCGSE